MRAFGFRVSGPAARGLGPFRGRPSVRFLKKRSLGFTGSYDLRVLRLLAGIGLWGSLRFRVAAGLGIGYKEPIRVFAFRVWGSQRLQASKPAFEVGTWGSWN